MHDLELPTPLPRNCPDRILFIDDHEAIIRGSVPILEIQYPKASIFTAKDRDTAWDIVRREMPDLVIIDLAIPEQEEKIARPSIGIDLLEDIMTLLPAPNILVMTTTVTALVRIRTNINIYGGGFAALDKARPIEVIAELADISMRGAVHLPGILRSRGAFEPTWLQVLHYRFEEGFTDHSIAKKLGVSDRTIRNYWVRIQDCLGIHDEPGIDSRTKIEIEARRLGLIG